MNEMQKLLLKLKNEHKTGKVYDNYHPELILCDFEGEPMKPKLKVYNSNGGRR